MVEKNITTDKELSKEIDIFKNIPPWPAERIKDYIDNFISSYLNQDLTIDPPLLQKMSERTESLPPRIARVPDSSLLKRITQQIDEDKKFRNLITTYVGTERTDPTVRGEAISELFRYILTLHQRGRIKGKIKKYSIDIIEKRLDELEQRVDTFDNKFQEAIDYKDTVLRR